jgi:formylglycine-generating enzyme required for sulfatase activity
MGWLRGCTFSLPLLAAFFWLTTSASAVKADWWVPVGDPGNAADTTGYGAVPYPYEISKYEVTNAQYAWFLNAVGATDTYALYNTNMGSGYGGITRSGSPGSYTYSAIAGRENMPVIYVSWYDALRFANWRHNGQPTGAQDASTTEDGAYDMSLGSSVVRKAGARVFLTSEDEWYKAAYYDAGLASYFEYPAGSDTETTCAMAGPMANTANCGGEVGDLTDVGSYTGSPSPTGTFDQGGNVWEWNEALIGSERGLRGSGYYGDRDGLEASRRFGFDPTCELYHLGFRVARSVSGLPSLSPVGLVLLTGGILLVSVGLVRLRA